MSWSIALTWLAFAASVFPLALLVLPGIVAVALPRAQVCEYECFTAQQRACVAGGVALFVYPVVALGNTAVTWLFSPVAFLALTCMTALACTATRKLACSAIARIVPPPLLQSLAAYTAWVDGMVKLAPPVKGIEPIADHDDAVTEEAPTAADAKAHQQ